jgi:hypothetical protein
MAEHGFNQFEIAAQMAHTDNGATALKHYIKTDRDRLFERIERGFKPVTPLRPIDDSGPTRGEAV